MIHLGHHYYSWLHSHKVYCHMGRFELKTQKKCTLWILKTGEWIILFLQSYTECPVNAHDLKFMDVKCHPNSGMFNFFSFQSQLSKEGITSVYGRKCNHERPTPLHTPPPRCCHLWKGVVTSVPRGLSCQEHHSGRPAFQILRQPTCQLSVPYYCRWSTSASAIPVNNDNDNHNKAAIYLTNTDGIYNHLGLRFGIRAVMLLL